MNNPAEHPVVTNNNGQGNPNLIAEHIDKVWRHLEARKLETYKHLFRSFSTLSDVQELIAMGSTEEANDLINKAKMHLNDAIAPTGDGADLELYSKAMFEVSVNKQS